MFQTRDRESKAYERCCQIAREHAAKFVAFSRIQSGVLALRRPCSYNPSLTRLHASVLQYA
jgi:hypothetical protein